MKTIEIAVYTTTAGAEIVADFLSAFSYSGVLIKDKNDILTLQNERKETWDYIDEALLQNIGNDVLVSGFVEKKKHKEIIAELQNKLAELKSEISEIDFGLLDIKTFQVDDKAWHKVWKKNFRPIKIKDIVICPKWLKHRPADEEKVVLLNSGMAFGTGEHETTSMCIELMQDFDFKGKTLIDVGCGSGILGITAAKIGAEFCYMTDIDSMAIAATNKNAKINKVSKTLKIENRSLVDGADLRADFILANLTAGLLIMLESDIKTVAKDNSTVIMSGIITEKIDEVIDCYTAAGFKLFKKLTKGEWCALAFQIGKAE